MPDTPISDASLSALDREIAYQKQLEKTVLEERSPVETLYSWTALERDFVTRNRNWYVTTAAIALGCIVYAALTRNYLLIFVIIALVVVIYTINTIPPHETKHQVTNRGLYSFNTMFLWKNMICFWVTQRDQKYFLHIEYKGKVTDMVYSNMVLLIGRGNLSKIVTYMVEHVDYLGPEEITQNSITRWAQGTYLPLLDIVGEKNISTKDPNDSPLFLKARRRTPKPA